MIDLSLRYSASAVPLLRLTYVSRRLPQVSDDAMVNVLLSASVRNYLAGVSAKIWFSPRFFAQVLEGSLGAVEPLYARICQDARHEEVTCVDRLRSTPRTFVRPLTWHRVTGAPWSITCVPTEEADQPFEEASEALIRRGPVTNTR